MTDTLLITPLPWQTAITLTLAFLFILFLPGFLLSWLCFDRRSMSWLLRLPISVVLSISLILALATLVLLADWHLAVLFWAVAGLIVAETVALVLRRRRAPAVSERQDLVKINRLLGIACILVTILAIVRFCLPINRYFPFGGDFWAYLAYVRKWATLGARPAVSVIFGTPISGFRNAFGGWLLIQSLLSIASGVDPIDISGIWLPPVLMLTSCLGFFALARTLFRNGNAAILATLVHILHLSLSIDGRNSGKTSLGRLFFFRINEDKFLINLILLPMATLFLIRYLRSNRKTDLLCLVLTALALPLMHPLGLVEAALTFGLFAVVYFLFNLRRDIVRRFVLIFVPLILLLIIPLWEVSIYRKPTSLETAWEEGYKASYKDLLLVFDIANNNYITHPNLLRSPVMIAGLILTPLLLFYLKRDVAAQYLFANMAGLLLLLYTPFLTPLLGRLITPWNLWRLTYLLPASLIIGFLLEKGMNLVQRLWQKRRGPETPFIALLPLSLLLISALIFWRMGQIRVQILEAPVYSAEADLLLQARQFVREPAMIMCREPFSGLLPAFLQYGFVPYFRQHAVLEDAEKDVPEFYQAPMMESEEWDILLKYKASYLIADLEQASSYFWLSPLLSPLYANERYVLYRVTPAPPDHPLILGNTAFAQEDWSAAAAAYEIAATESSLVPRLRLAEIQAREGYPAAAAQAFEQIVAQRPDDPWAHAYAARFYQQEKKRDAAIQHYTQALNLARPGESPVATIIDGLVRLSFSSLLVIPEKEYQRWGVGLVKEYGEITDFNLDPLRIGWYTDGEVREDPSPLPGVEHVQVVKVREGSYPPDWASLERALYNQPGAIWLIGLFPEWDRGGNRTPKEYAEIYHDLYFFIKERDPIAQVAAGGIMEPTSLRLRWLGSVLSAYQKRYHARLPADAWHIGNFILREEAGAWGAGIPVGVQERTGQLYEIADNADVVPFRQHILIFRRWMADRGERAKPLIISGYGVQVPSDLLLGEEGQSGNTVIKSFMKRTFTFCRNYRDANTGCLLDDNRLVQRWLWFSLNDQPYDPATGSGSNGMLFTRDGRGRPRLTTFGSNFADYMASLAQSSDEE